MRYFVESRKITTRHVNAAMSDGRRPGISSVRGILGARIPSLKTPFKFVANLLGMIVVAIPALMSRAEAAVSSRNDVFIFWGQGLSMVPGLPGRYLRRCFYFLTLDSCSHSCDIGFLSYFNDRRAVVGERVYVGYGVSVGLATLDDGALIGSRASLTSGGDQHRHDQDGKLTPFDRAGASRITIGGETWVGEGAVVMADVGSRCIVAAGSVVSQAVPDGCLVGGNPARFVKRLFPSAASSNKSEVRGTAIEAPTN